MFSLVPILTALIAILVIILIATSIRVVSEYQRLVVFRRVAVLENAVRVW